MLKHLRLKRPLVFLDAESTGVNPQSDRVVEIALLGSVCLSLAVRPIAPR
jgi:oligoribonuclease (3'-5' exoribonuclease)